MKAALARSQPSQLAITPDLLTRYAGDIAGRTHTRGAICIVVDHDGTVIAGSAGLTADQQQQALRLAERQMPAGRIDRVRL